MEHDLKNKKPMGPSVWWTSLRSQSVDRQARVAVVLMTIMPALSFLYVGLQMTDEDAAFPFAPLIVTILTSLAAVCGWQILWRYSKNITCLREHIINIAHGTLPEPVHLYQSGENDDLKCIEEGLNIILYELETRVKLVEEKLKVESGLRKALEEQHQMLLDAERQRVMMQSLGAACHHLGQPATALRLRLHLMREKVNTLDEMDAIDASIRDMEAIDAILKKLRDVNVYRTEPYLKSSDMGDSQILAI